MIDIRPKKIVKNLVGLVGPHFSSEWSEMFFGGQKKNMAFWGSTLNPSKACKSTSDSDPAPSFVSALPQDGWSGLVAGYSEQYQKAMQRKDDKQQPNINQTNQTT